MTFNRLPYLSLGLVTLLTLAGCTGKFLSPAATTAQARGTTSTKLPDMNEGFLYLAAQDAMRQGQQELAIQFLSALVKKNPDAVAPRMQLAELLLRSNRADQASEHIDILIGDSTPASAATPEEAQPHILRARALAISGNVDEALDILSTLLAQQPTLAQARILHISFLVSMKRINDAHQSINTGLRHEETPELRKIEADLLIRQNRLDEAIRVLKAMQKLDVNDETPTLLLSQIAMQQQKVHKAEKILRTYINQRPGAILVRNALGRLLVQSGRTKEAIDIYRGLVRDTGGTAEALSTLGLLYYQNREFELAAKQFRNALASQSNDQARFYLAASLEALGRQDEAKELYQAVNSNSSAFIDAQLRLAGLELTANNIRAAKKRTKTILANYPNEGDAYMLLSSIYLIEQKFQPLLDETEVALSFQQVPSRLLFNRAIAYEHFKRYEDVEKSLKQLISSNPDHSEALNFLGYVYAEQGIKLDEAKRLIEQALVKKPNDGYYLDSLAWVYFKQGNYSEAAKLQRAAIKQIKDDPVMFEHLGDILWRSGSEAEARASWEKAIELKHEKPQMIHKKIAEGLPAQ